MEEIIYIISFLLFLTGIVGSIVPGLPGPFISYVGVLLLYYNIPTQLTTYNILIMGLFMVICTGGDYVLQIFGVKKLGGGKNAIMGTIIGTIIGLFLTPIGIVLGALIGAFIGAKSETDDNIKALKITLGAFIGFILGTTIKLIYTIYLFFYIFTVF